MTDQKVKKWQLKLWLHFGHRFYAAKYKSDLRLSCCHVGSKRAFEPLSVNLDKSELFLINAQTKRCSAQTPESPKIIPSMDWDTSFEYLGGKNIRYISTKATATSQTATYFTRK